MLNIGFKPIKFKLEYKKNHHNYKNNHPTSNHRDLLGRVV